MSIVIAVFNSERCCMAADSRCTDIDENGNFVILTEQFKKLHKMFQNVAVGFAGNVDDCYKAYLAVHTKLLLDTSKQYADMVAQDLYQYLLTIAGKPNANAQILVGGKCGDGRIRLYRIICSIHHASHLPTIEIFDSNGPSQIKYAIVSSLQANDPLVDEIMNSDGRIEDRMARLIAAASQKNPTINNNIRWEDVYLRREILSGNRSREQT